MAEHNPTQKAPIPGVKLEIIFDRASGRIGVNIPTELLGNHLVCYGLLEVARQTIQRFAEEQAKNSRIVPATTLPFVRPA